MTPAGTTRSKCGGTEPAAGKRGVAVVIPARLASQRFPGKVLARETGKYLVQHVWEGVRGTPGGDRVIIATDSDQVREAARSFGAEVLLTSPSHPSGTDRVAEVAKGLAEEIIINVQGGEPLTRHQDIEQVIRLVEAGDDVVMTTLAVRRDDADGKLDPNNVKVVVDFAGRAIYFSRAPIPFQRDAGIRPEWLHHVGIYGYRRRFLLEFAGLRPGGLEGMERPDRKSGVEGKRGDL